jgi:hypothetical protein
MMATSRDEATTIYGDCFTKQRRCSSQEPVPGTKAVSKAGGSNCVRLGFKRAAVAVARKLAVIMHSMLKTGEVFNTLAGATA